MRFLPTQLSGAVIIELEPYHDHRGFFARTFCEREFAEHGLPGRFVQCNIAWNKEKGTLRGMHYQADPYAESKLVRCTRGAIYDVIVDIRKNSATHGKWISVELTGHNGKMLFVPEGFAHGYQTLEPDSEVFYQMGAFPQMEYQRGIRWNDPTLAIQWTLPNPIMSERDKAHPDFASI